MTFKNVIISGLSIFTLIFSAVAITSCSKNEREIITDDDSAKEEEVILKLSTDNISVAADAVQEIVQLTTNADWHIENPASQDGWCNISPVSGNAGTVVLSINIQANGYDKREHVFNIKAGNEEVSLTVIQKQLGFFQFILTETNGNIFYDEGGVCNVLATTSLEYDIEYTGSGSEWISQTTTKALTQETISFTIAEYTGNTQRECDIIFKERDGELKDTVHVIQYHDMIVEFDDNNFKHFCLTQYDTNNDGEITKREALNITSLIIFSLNSISSLHGIEEFENLMMLNCNGYDISSLDVSRNTKLFSLDCDDNNLTSLDLSNNPDLQILSCDNNELTQLIVANQDWVSLSCENNLLTSLGTPDYPVKASSLYCCDNRLKDLYITASSRGGTSVSCKNNCLTEIDLTSCPDITYLYCNNNDLRKLDIQNNHKLTYLDCDNNELNSIEIPANNLLSHLSIDDNSLTEIDLSDCIYLNWLSISGNDISKIDLSSCTDIESLSISDNDISSLDVSKLGSLKYLYCYSNPLQSITISSNQENADWMSSSFNGIRYYYPDIEVIIK